MTISFIYFFFFGAAAVGGLRAATNELDPIGAGRAPFPHLISSE